MESGKRTAPTIVDAVKRSIETMRENLSEPLSIDDIAGFAMYSKFHFSREFQRVTGVSPGRFLSAMRIREAKKLLLTTDLTVTDISHMVGYSSVGTFSSRFSDSVGIAPSAYRRFNGFVHSVKVGRRRDARGSVYGSVTAPEGADLGLLFLGLFPTRVPEGKPASCTILSLPGPFKITGVPAGTWFLLGHSVPGHACEALTEDQAVHVGALGPLEVRRDTPLGPTEFRLRGKRVLDPPILVALQRVRSEAFQTDIVRAAR